MPIIRPVSDLRNNFSEIEALSKKQPVFLTKNGVGSMVVLSMDDYDRTILMADVYRKIAEAEAAIVAEDTGKDYKRVFSELRGKING